MEIACPPFEKLPSSPLGIHLISIIKQHKIATSWLQKQNRKPKYLTTYFAEFLST
jgi:hypothetical protein